MGVSNVGGGQRTAGPRERHVIRATTRRAYVHAPRKWANTPRAARTHTHTKLLEVEERSIVVYTYTDVCMCWSTYVRVLWPRLSGHAGATMCGQLHTSSTPPALISSPYMHYHHRRRQKAAQPQKSERRAKCLTWTHSVRLHMSLEITWLFAILWLLKLT